MSVFDMMQKAMVEKLMLEGPAMLRDLLANIPPETLAQVQQISQFHTGLGATLARIEMRQRLIMNHLGISETEDDHARQPERSLSE